MEDLGILSHAEECSVFAAELVGTSEQPHRSACEVVPSLDRVDDRPEGDFVPEFVEVAR